MNNAYDWYYGVRFGESNMGKAFGIAEGFVASFDAPGWPPFPVVDKWTIGGLFLGNWAYDKIMTEG